MLNLLAVLALLQDAEIKITPSRERGFAKIVATSKIYEVRTDCDTDTAKEVVRLLEGIHHAMMAEFKIPTSKIDGLLPVSFYATTKSFAKEQPMAAMGMGGYYDPPSKMLHCALQQPNGDDWRLVLKHEGTHQLLHRRMDIGTRPPGQGSSVWFNEGFASYWATAAWDGKKASTGDPHPMLLKEYRKLEKSKELMSLEELVEAKQGPMMRTIYAQGWALCHFLRHSRWAGKFGAYLESERKGDISFADFTKAFGIEKPADVEKEFQKHMAALK